MIVILLRNEIHFWCLFENMIILGKMSEAIKAHFLPHINSEEMFFNLMTSNNMIILKIVAKIYRSAMFYSIANMQINFKGIARTLKKSKGDYWIKQWFSSIAPILKWELLLKVLICSQK